MDKKVARTVRDTWPLLTIADASTADGLSEHHLLCQLLSNCKTASTLEPSVQTPITPFLLLFDCRHRPLHSFGTVHTVPIVSAAAVGVL